ncbi:acyl-CoA dehydrogenase family protein [Achromobacter pestifer]|uniref:Putative acyl-CoA dehydrogenase fadE25 n=1 Tax=Achromobacter pestifer TaxID=1353889 RepID=A0A6S6YM33_9BURK|nr:acyl-CoA dehydrogenase family protein [Achromobacter pestifer]CAB3631170.1 putative acyl-CoA dehydrogenase fadE25 [Achromobacter pestifer]
MRTDFVPLHQRESMDLPFFEPVHRDYLQRVEAFADGRKDPPATPANVDACCRDLVRAMGKAGLLRASVPQAYGGDAPTVESRRLVLAREALAYRHGLADFAFAMQGLGSGAISLAGSDALKARILPNVASGECIPAFALSEKEAGSDAAGMQCRARLEGDHYLINGEKTWISNGGIADVYTLFARTEDAAGTRGISAFVVYPDDPGFSISERIDVMAPHPLATLRFDNLRIPADRLLGEPGEGFKLAMRTLDIFRVSVAGAALGFARRAFDEAVAHARSRRMFGGALGDLQLTQSKLGDMAVAIDSAALLTYRAAWRRDAQGLPTTREAAMAKLAATENAQAVVDMALQLFGARGVRVGETLESLYREIRALRIYEGASEVQKIIIARDALRAAA